MKIWLSLLLFIPTILGPAPFSLPGLYIWNVGQGSWATEITPDACLHFDMGGEFSPFERIFKLCALKKNILYLSHWDWDHISFIRKFRAKNPNLCLAKEPAFAANTSARKKALAGKIPICQSSPTGLNEIYSGNRLARVHEQNALSQVYYNELSSSLWPGDSTRAEEKYWNVAKIKRLRVFVLGHHGSLTSTSVGLLQSLPRAKMAVASSRYERYRHPHLKVVQRLGQHKIPLLQTEKWGNLIFLSK
jgi:competence protein ComEC